MHAFFGASLALIAYLARATAVTTAGPWFPSADRIHLDSDFLQGGRAEEREIVLAAAVDRHVPSFPRRPL